MADTGFKSPTANAAAHWTLPDNAHATDDAYADTISNGAFEIYSTFDIISALPANAIIVGIEATVEGHAQNGAGNDRRLRLALSWDGGSTYSTAKDSTAFSATPDDNKTYGGSADTWGRSWTRDEFSDANFRLRGLQLGTGDTNRLNIDHIQVKVYYLLIVQKSLTYKVIKEISVTKSLNYEVLKENAITKSLTYAVLAPFQLKTDQINFGFEQVTTTAITKSLKYTVLTDTSITKSLTYYISIETAITKTLVYKVLAEVTITKSLTYVIEGQGLSVTKDLKYTVITENPITKSLTYRIFIEDIAITKSLTYSIALENAITKSLRYVIFRTVSITKGLTYEVLTDQAITKSLTYYIFKENAITKSLKYSIFREVKITKSLRYFLLSEKIRYPKFVLEKNYNLAIKASGIEAEIKVSYIQGKLGSDRIITIEPYSISGKVQYE